MRLHFSGKNILGELIKKICNIKWLSVEDYQFIGSANVSDKH